MIIAGGRERGGGGGGGILAKNFLSLLQLTGTVDCGGVGSGGTSESMHCLFNFHGQTVPVRARGADT